MLLWGWASGNIFTQFVGYFVGIIIFFWIFKWGVKDDSE
jgi:hypothetical protein